MMGASRERGGSAFAAAAALGAIAIALSSTTPAAALRLPLSQFVPVLRPGSDVDSPDFFGMRKSHEVNCHHHCSCRDACIRSRSHYACSIHSEQQRPERRACGRQDRSDGCR